MLRGVSLMQRYGTLSATSAAYARFHLLRSSNNNTIDHFCVTFLILSDQLIRGESSIPISTWRIIRFMSEGSKILSPFDPNPSLEVGPILRVFGHVHAHMQSEGGFNFVPWWVCAFVCVH